MNVLLLPGGATADAVAERLCAWSAAGLLTPFCLWRATDEDPRVLQRVNGGEQVELAFAEALGDAEPTTVAFAAVHPARADESFDPAFVDDAAELLALATAEVFDFDAARPPACTLIAVPEAAGQRVPSALFRTGWANLYVAPEDRRQPGGLNRLVGDPDRYVGHAAHAAATLAELWATPDAHRVGLLERLRGVSTGPLAVGVRVVRCYSRIVELGYVADHVAAWALSTEDGWPRPDAERFDRPREPEPIVAALAEAYLTAHEVTLDRHRFRPIGEPPPEEVSLAEGWRRFLDSVRARMRKRPIELADVALARVYESTARYLELLSDGSFRIRPWRDLDEEERSLEHLRERVAGPLLVSEGPVRETWVDLRMLTLGLVDGSRLPQSVDTRVLQREGRQYVICDPALLAYDPAVPRDLMAVVAERPPDPELDTAPGAAAATAQAPATHGPDGAHLPLLEQIRVRVVDARDRARKRARALEEMLKEFESAAEPAGQSPAEHYRRSFNGLARLVGFYTVVALAATLGVASLLPLGGAIAAGLAVAGLWMYLTASAASRTLLHPRIADDARAARQLSHLNATLELGQAQGDARRLERRCAELEVWIEILGELLHRPWAREPFGTLELSPSTDASTLPAACAVAVAPPDPRVLERLGSRARAYAFRPGWLTGIYDHVEQLTMDDYVTARGGVLLAPDPAEDTTEDPDSPREALRTAVSRGDGRQLSDNPLVSHLRDAVDHARIEEVAPTVVRAGRGVRPLEPTTTWIAAPERLVEEAVGNAARVVSLHPLAAAGVLLDSRTVLTAEVAVEVRRVRVMPRGGGVVEPVEVRRFPEHGLALLRFDDDVTPAALALPETGGVERGDGVVALDAPAGRVTTHWGLVTRRQARLGVVYDAGGPLVGAGVFDVDGRLVAIQGIDGAHPVGDLSVLLEAPPTQEAAAADEAAPAGGAPRGTPARAGRAMPTDGARPEPVLRFLDAITTEEDELGAYERALSPALWLPFSDANGIELTLPPALALAGDDARVDRLTDGAAFMRPLRVVVHRVEATRPVAPSELSACEE